MSVALRTDEELLAAVADGDRGALRELHDRHVVWVSARLRRRCADRDVVAEAVQDTFVAVWKGAGRWDGRGEPAAWIWGIAIRRLIGVLRTREPVEPGRVGAEVTEPEVMVAAEDQVLVGVEHGDLAGALRACRPSCGRWSRPRCSTASPPVRPATCSASRPGPSRPA